MIYETKEGYSLNLSEDIHESDLVFVTAIEILTIHRALQPRELYNKINEILGKKYKERQILGYLTDIAREEKTSIRRIRYGPLRRSKEYFYLYQYKNDLGEIYARDISGRTGKPYIEEKRECPKKPFSDVSEFINYLKEKKKLTQITYIKDIPSKDAIYGYPKQPLNPKIEKYLRSISTYPLFIHQAKAIDLVREGKNILVTTPNSSGKTLCYLIPIFEKSLEDRNSTFIYISPVKALAHDQLKKFDDFEHELKTGIYPCTYDGDTPSEFREKIRRNSKLILTNPDELHYGILPFHEKWGHFFENLKFIIIDEIHSYRGIFGSHVSNIMKRLNRICKFYNSEPQYIGISATIYNPEEFATKLTGKKFTIIHESGAPSPNKLFILWNPIKNEKDLLDRGIPFRDSKLLFIEHITHNIHTLMFELSRKAVEIQVREIKNKLSDELCDRVASYRAGYTDRDRRIIEERLRNKDLLGVISTNALELGIDIGALDATILVGYPGTIASTWQQANRAGRREKEALITFIALNDPLNQYLINNPNYFFEKEPEEVVINPYNEYIFLYHIMCAATELPPLKIDDEIISSSSFIDSIPQHISDPIYRDGDKIISTHKKPHRYVNIRSSTSYKNQIKIISLDDSSEIGESDYEKALEELHPGAVYLAQGESYYTEKLDLETNKAYVKKLDLDYYTVPSKEIIISNLQKEKEKTIGGININFGRLLVKKRVVAFYKMEYITGRKIDYIPLNLPEIFLETEGLWLEFSDIIIEKIGIKKDEAYNGIHAITHLLLSLLPLHILCDRRDVDGFPDGEELLILFLFDNYRGGIGLCKRGFEYIDSLLNESLRTVKTCKCEEGCPSCIHIPTCTLRNEKVDKKSAIKILEYIAQGKK